MYGHDERWKKKVIFGSFPDFYRMDAMYSYIKLQTSGGFLLDALWCGPLHPKTVFIFIHGLGSNVFSHHELLSPLVNEETSVLFFSNRGHDTVTTVKKIDRRKKHRETNKRFSIH